MWHLLDGYVSAQANLKSPTSSGALTRGLAVKLNPAGAHHHFPQPRAPGKTAKEYAYTSDSTNRRLKAMQKQQGQDTSERQRATTNNNERNEKQQKDTLYKLNPGVAIH